MTPQPLKTEFRDYVLVLLCTNYFITPLVNLVIIAPNNRQQLGPKTRQLNNLIGIASISKHGLLEFAFYQDIRCDIILAVTPPICTPDLITLIDENPEASNDDNI